MATMRAALVAQGLPHSQQAHLLISSQGVGVRTIQVIGPGGKGVEGAQHVGPSHVPYQHARHRRGDPGPPSHQGGSQRKISTPKIVQGPQPQGGT